LELNAAKSFKYFSFVMVSLVPSGEYMIDPTGGTYFLTSPVSQ